MNTEKLTAVEWLFYRMIMDKTLSEKADFMHEAKEMEKNQIMDAYKADLYPCSDEDAEDYYNQTFK